MAVAVVAAVAAAAAGVAVVAASDVRATKFPGGFGRPSGVDSQTAFGGGCLPCKGCVGQTAFGGDRRMGARQPSGWRENPHGGRPSGFPPWPVNACRWLPPSLPSSPSSSSWPKPSLAAAAVDGGGWSSPQRWPPASQGSDRSSPWWPIRPLRWLPLSSSPLPRRRCCSRLAAAACCCCLCCCCRCDARHYSLRGACRR